MPEPLGAGSAAGWDGCSLPALRRESHFGDRVLHCFAERATSWYGLLADTVARFAEREAMVFGEQRWTWSQLGQQVEGVAAGLAAQGLARGDRLVLYLSNRPEFVLSLFAAQRLGLVVVPVGTREQREGLGWILAHSGARAIVADADLLDRLPAANTLAQPVLVVACAPPQDPATERAVGADPALPPGVLAFAELARQGADLPVVSVDEEDTAAILYTSGTTGRPKGAMLTHLNVVHSVQHYASCWQLDAQDRSMLCVPASHVTGLIANIALMAGIGGALIIAPAFKAASFLALAARERMTHTLMVPAMYKLMLLEAGLDAADLSAWRVGGYGGAPMPVATIDELGARLPGLTLVNAYGATETTSPTTLMPLGRTREHADTVGRPLPCAEVMAVDDEGRELPAGEQGELWIAGPMVVRAYWNDEAATAREFTAGWWHSGDVGSVDAQGFVRVFDRKKDMLNRGGYKIYSVEVENTLAQMPGVVEAAIVGKPCPVLGERVHAFVHTLRTDLDAAAIQAFCADRLADYKIPESVTLTAAPLPRNLNGKLLKRELRMALQQAESGALTGG